MRAAEREERERAAFALATAYASPSPVRTAASSGGWATCRRPMSARSTASNRHVATGGRASSARSRRGWVGEIDEQLSLGLDFRRRRAALMSRPRGPACETKGGGAVNDLESLEDQNQRLKVALSRLVEENKRYRVNKARLEAELLRADNKVEILLSELEQAPGKRDQRLLNAARMEVEKCAVVRSLAKQKEHLQKMLARQERELDAMRQTKEWSAVVEMTAATEEYFLEIRRLQRLLGQQQQQVTSASHPVAGVSDRDVSDQRAPTQRRNSGVDGTVWIHRPETCDVSMSIPSPVDGVQDQCTLDAETAFARGGGEVFSSVGHRPTCASAVQATEVHIAHREDTDTLLHEWGVPASRRRPASPKRKVSPPRRARMATRAGREVFDDGIHKKVSEEPRGSRQKTQGARGVLGRKQRGGSQSQGWIRAAEARTSARGVDARRTAVGVRSRPLSAPRTKRELKMTTMGDARGADSLSLFDKGRRQADSSDRGASPGRGGGGSAAGVRQKTARRRFSSSSHSPADHRIPTVPVPTEPQRGETGQKRRPNPRSRSASPRSSSSRNRTDAGDVFRAKDEGETKTAHASNTRNQTKDRDNGGGISCGDGDSDDGLPGVAVAPRSSQRVGDELESPPLRDHDLTSDDLYYDDANRQRSSWVPSRDPLAAASSAEHPSATVDKECIEGAKEGQQEQTVDRADSGDAENASKDEESRVSEGNELARNLIESGSPSWASFEADGEPSKNEAKREITEVGSATPASSPTSTDVDAREIPNADLIGEKNTTSTSNINSDDGGEQQVSAAGKTGELPSDASRRSGGNGSPNDGDTNSRRSSPVPEVGDDNTITRSVSSNAVTEKAHQGKVEVDAEMEADKLLFDIEGAGDSVGEDPLSHDNGAAQSEYGDDFDDFEDEED